VSEPSEPLPLLPLVPFATRLWFAWACFFRVLFDGAFASRAWIAREEAAALPGAPVAPQLAQATQSAKAVQPASASASASASDGALQLLALLQREGRLVDFLEQDIASFGDAEVGVAARVVHDGCQKALRAHATLAPVRTEEEGASVTLEAGFAPSDVKLSGNVRGSAPYRGALRHRGWRATTVSLPTALDGHDFRVIAPAEVEL
jgi:hypothetical protein